MLAHQMQQNSRLTSERARTCNTRSFAMPSLANRPLVHVEASHFDRPSPFDNQLQVSHQNVEDVPPADKCIGQVVLDWEFIHDLDVHLLKVVPAQQDSYHQNGMAQEPQPEPESLEAGSIDVELGELVDPITNELKLSSGQKMQQIVWYGNKVFNPRGAATPQAVLQLDRNAAVHSIKPVENLYLTNELDAGIYVVGVHNFSQHQLNDNVIGASADHTYHSFEEFKKKDVGYQMMEKALNEQLLHADDPDGTPEKVAIMTKVDDEMAQGSAMMQRHCCTGTGKFGVHYVAMIYSYPANASKHPQTCTVEELQNDFSAEMFATSECIFNPEANHGGYNGANVLAEVATEEGKLALSHSQAAHVALIKVVRDKASDTAKVVEVRMLRGMPNNRGITPCNGGLSVMNQFQALMGSRREVMMPQQQRDTPQHRRSRLRCEWLSSQRTGSRREVMPQQQQASPQHRRSRFRYDWFNCLRSGSYRSKFNRRSRS